ncbi:hypothetical protein BJX99DRAFT_137604 [Aspergillus californicus]
MDVDPSISRDPRLSNRAPRPPLPARLSHNEVPQRPPSTHRNNSVTEVAKDMPGDDFIRALGNLVETAVFRTTSTVERERLHSKRRHTQELLNRARAVSGFPSTLEHFQQARKEEDGILSSLDKKIGDYDSRYKLHEADLKSKWAVQAESQVPKSDDRISKLQHELKSANDRISKLNKDIDEVNYRNKRLDGELQDLHDSAKAQKQGLGDCDAELDSLRKRLSDCTKDQDGFSRDLDENWARIKDHSTRLKRIEEAPKPEAGSTDGTHKALGEISDQYKKLEHKTTELSQKMELLFSLHQRIAELPDQVDRTLKDQQQKLEAQQQKLDQLVNGQASNPKLENTVKDQQQKLEAQQQKLDQLANGQASNPKLENTVNVLDSKLEDLLSIQTAKDDMQMAELEEIRGSISTTNEDHQKLSSNVQQLSQSLGYRLATLSSDLMQWRQKLEVVNVALRSLESRYNNLSTDTIVQHMVGAIMEMYPSMDQIRHGMSELQPIKAKIGQLEGDAKNTASLKDQLNALHAEQNKVSQFFEHFRGQFQWLSQEDFQAMRANLKEIAENHKNLDGEFFKKKAADQTSMQEIERERESLNTRFANLNDDLEKLKAERAQATSGAFNHDDMRSLELRLGALEKSSISSYEKLKGQVDSLKKNIHPPQRPPQREKTPENNLPPPSRPAPLDTASGIKIKRRHTSTYSDDERSPLPTRSNSIISQDSTTSPHVAPGSELRKKKKKKKRRLEGEPPIQIND